MGFLSASPEGWEGRTRQDMWDREGLDPGLPDVSGVTYLLDWLQEDQLGWFRQSDMGGLHPLDWAEIDAFARLQGFELEPWESQQIRACSVAYITGHRMGAQPMTVSPVFADRPGDDPGVAVERRKVSEQMKAGLRGIASGR